MEGRGAELRQGGKGAEARRRLRESPSRGTQKPRSIHPRHPRIAGTPQSDAVWRPAPKLHTATQSHFHPHPWNKLAGAHTAVGAVIGIAELMVGAALGGGCCSYILGCCWMDWWNSRPLHWRDCMKSIR